MGFVVPLLCIALATIATSLVANLDFGKSLAPTLIIAGIVVYLSALIVGSLFAGIVVCAVLFAGVLGVAIWRSAKRGALKRDLERVLSFSFVLFLVVYVCIYVYDLNRSFTRWDEFSHWGVMVKEMMRLDVLYSDPQSVLTVHKDYPPFASIIEYIYAVLSCGGYQEAFLYRGLHLFIFSLAMIPLTNGDYFSRISKRNVAFLLVLPACFFLVYSFMPMEDGPFDTIYTDILVATLAAVSLYAVMFESIDELSSAFVIASLLVALLLTKQIGVAFFALALFALCIRLLFIKRERDVFVNSGPRNIIAAFMLTIVFPIAALLLWNKNVSDLSLNQQFSASDLKIGDLGGIVAGTGGYDWQQDVVAAFFDALIHRPILDARLPLTMPVFILAICILLLLASIVVNRFSEASSNCIGKGVILVVTLVVGCAGYSFTMLVLYVFSFGKYEASLLASFDRYIATYMLLGALLLFFVLEAYLSRSESPKGAFTGGASLLSLCLIGALLGGVSSTLDRLVPAISPSEANEFTVRAALIAEATEEDARIHYIAQNSSPQANYYLGYYLVPRGSNGNHNYRFGPSEENELNTEASFEEIKGILADADYVYLSSVDDYFAYKYAGLFENVDEIENGALYKVGTSSDDSMMLTRVRWR